MALPTAPPGARVVTLEIDGRDLSARDSESIIEVCREHGIPIPSLCYLDGLSVWGACRLCMVEINGQARLLSACSTLAAEGMKVCTDSERLRRYRRMIVELLLAERSHVCSVCVSGVNHVRVPYRQVRYAMDNSHPSYRLDQNRCVLCTRCVRVCDEIEGAHTWDVMGRGADCMVISDMARPWGESETCTDCGKCVQVCPTGALVKHGTSVGEMVKDQHFLPILARRRHSQ
jgi:bidirectional [NiFe] hydrogenase diaphorase subunit